MDNLYQSFVLAQAFGGGSGGGGGGGTAVVENDVNFFDYDGTLLHSYSAADFAALTELPENPTHDGLTAQGWNYSLADAQAYVASYGMLDIGQTYITNDGKTRLYISITQEYRMSPTIYFTQTVSNGVTIDWGDGSATETKSGTGSVNASHTYASVGDYVISLDVDEGCALNFGNGSQTTSIMGNGSTGVRAYNAMLRRVEIGEGVTSFAKYAFYECRSLSTITLPVGFLRLYYNSFGSCYAIKHINFPSGMTTIEGSAFNSCGPSTCSFPNSITSLASSFSVNIKRATLPESITSIQGYAFNDSRNLETIIIPDSITTVSDYAFYRCYSLKAVILKEVTSIARYAFSECGSLMSVTIKKLASFTGSDAFLKCCSITSIVFPETLTNIPSETFNSCYSMALYDFTALPSVPTLSATSAFTGIKSDCKIVVPDSLYDTWIAETNWSTYASYIMRESDYNA